MLISLLLILPFVCSCLMLASSSRDVNSSFRLGLSFAAIPLILATALIFAGGQHTENRIWFSFLEVDFGFSLYGHGLSLWMAWLTSLLCFLAFAYFRDALSFGVKKFAVGILTLEGTIIGAFLSAKNLVQFLFFFEAMILPTAVIIALYGGLKRRRAVVTFSLYTLAGSIPLLFAAWYLILKAGSDDIGVLAQTLKTLPAATQTSLFTAFAIAFAVKTPVFPFHSWQGISYTEAPYPLSAILSGAMAKVGIFGFAIWTIPIFNVDYKLLLIPVALFSALYGAALALMQTNIKRLLAFSSMSHLGLALAGLFCLDEIVNAGVAVMLVGHGLTAGGLFFFGGIAQKWTGSTNIKNFGAFASTNPVFASIFGFLSIAAVAVPCTVGFVGEFLILQGLFNSGLPLFGVIGGICIVCSAAYMLRLIKNVLFGPIPENPARTGISLSKYEGITAVPIMALIIYFGLHPAPILDSFETKEKNETLTEMEMQEFEKFLESLLNVESIESATENDSLENEKLEENDDEQ
ncbi:MAG: NADH-quinone oxidoreductase subunit M [Fibromonadales bacterium]|nr:NADH-quinone oxidoreductase subunit M [Fibromonadales bacterium]